MFGEELFSQRAFYDHCHKEICRTLYGHGIWRKTPEDLKGCAPMTLRAYGRHRFFSELRALAEAGKIVNSNGYFNESALRNHVKSQLQTFNEVHGFHPGMTLDDMAERDMQAQVDFTTYLAMHNFYEQRCATPTKHSHLHGQLTGAESPPFFVSTPSRNPYGRKRRYALPDRY